MDAELTREAFDEVYRRRPSRQSAIRAHLSKITPVWWVVIVLVGINAVTIAALFYYASGVNDQLTWHRTTFGDIAINMGGKADRNYSALYYHGNGSLDVEFGLLVHAESALSALNIGPAYTHTTNRSFQRDVVDVFPPPAPETRHHKDAYWPATSPGFVTHNTGHAKRSLAGYDPVTRMRVSGSAMIDGDSHVTCGGYYGCYLEAPVGNFTDLYVFNVSMYIPVRPYLDQLNLAVINNALGLAALTVVVDNLVISNNSVLCIVYTNCSLLPTSLLELYNYTYTYGDITDGLVLQVNALTIVTSSLITSVAVNTANITSLAVRVTSLEACCTGNTAAIAALMAFDAYANATLNYLLSISAASNSSLTILIARVDALNATVLVVQGQLNATNATVNNLQDRVDALNVTQVAHTAQLANISSLLTMVIVDLDTFENATAASLAALNATAYNLTVIVDLHTQQIANLTVCCTANTNGLAALNATVNTTVARVDALETCCADNNSTLANHTAQLSYLSSCCDNNTQCCANNSALITVLWANVSTLSACCDANTQCCANLTNLTAVLALQVQQLQNITANLTLQVDMINTVLNSSLNGTLAELEQLLANVTYLIQVVNNITQELENANITHVLNTLSYLNTSVIALQSDVLALQLCCSNLTAAVAALNSTTMALNSTQQVIIAQVAAMNTTIYNILGNLTAIWLSQYAQDVLIAQNTFDIEVLSNRTDALNQTLTTLSASFNQSITNLTAVFNALYQNVSNLEVVVTQQGVAISYLNTTLNATQYAVAAVNMTAQQALLLAQTVYNTTVDQGLRLDALNATVIYQGSQITYIYSNISDLYARLNATNATASQAQACCANNTAHIGILYALVASVNGTLNTVIVNLNATNVTATSALAIANTAFDLASVDAYLITLLQGNVTQLLAGTAQANATAVAAAACCAALNTTVQALNLTSTFSGFRAVFNGTGATACATGIVLPAAGTAVLFNTVSCAFCYNTGWYNVTASSATIPLTGYYYTNVKVSVSYTSANDGIFAALIVNGTTPVAVGYFATTTSNLQVATVHVAAEVIRFTAGTVLTVTYGNYFAGGAADIYVGGTGTAHNTYSTTWNMKLEYAG